MRVLIKEVHKEEDVLRVCFSTKFGTAIGKWRGEIPVINNEYFVEVDIPQVLTWGTDITLVESTSCKLFTTEGIVHLVGKLETVEDDGCAFVQFDDILIAIETEGEVVFRDSYTEFSVKEMILCEIKY